MVEELLKSEDNGIASLAYVVDFAKKHKFWMATVALIQKQGLFG